MIPYWYPTLLFRPTCGGGGGGGKLYTQMFFVQSIFADRYIHCRELRLVSLEISCSVEYGIKKFIVAEFYSFWIADGIPLFIFKISLFLLLVLLLRFVNKFDTKLFVKIIAKNSHFLFKNYPQIRFSIPLVPSRWQWRPNICCHNHWTLEKYY